MTTQPPGEVTQPAIPNAHHTLTIELLADVILWAEKLGAIWHPSDEAAAVRMLAAMSKSTLETFARLERTHTGMCYGDEKRGGLSDYARGWGDCLSAMKDALKATSATQKDPQP